MRLQTISLVQKQKTWLHLLLVAGIFLYFYSPLLDHWSGNETYIRPHTHIEVTNVSPQQHSDDSTAHASEHDEHDEEGVLCSLDLNALFSTVPCLSATPNFIIQSVSLIFDLFPAYQQVSAIYLSSLDPPPRI